VCTSPKRPVALCQVCTLRSCTYVVQFQVELVQKELLVNRFALSNQHGGSMQALANPLEFLFVSSHCFGALAKVGDARGLFHCPESSDALLDRGVNGPSDCRLLRAMNQSSSRIELD
jgi:hypothetical protein